MAIEVFNEDCPPELFNIGPDDGNVSFIATNSESRRECMKDATSLLLGAYGVVNQLSQLVDFEFLLQIIRIDITSVSIRDFADVFNRAHRAGEHGIGPNVFDGWMCSASSGTTRIVLGFIRMERPDMTMAEFMRPSDPSTVLTEDDLLKRVREAAPVAKWMLGAIANSYIDCWPGPMFSPDGVGLFLDERGVPVKAVVNDWSSCVMGNVTVARVLTSFLANYKDFIESIPVEHAGDKGLAFYQTLYRKITE